MSSKDGFEYSGKIAVEQASDYMNKLANGLRSRSVTLLGQGQEMKLAPEDIVKLKVKADCKDEKGKIELTISWKQKYAPAVSKLDISSGNTPETSPNGSTAEFREIAESRSRKKTTGVTNEQ